MNTEGFTETRSRQPSQTSRIYTLMQNLEDELASFVPESGCNACFAHAIMATRLALKTLKRFF